LSHGFRLERRKLVEDADSSEFGDRTRRSKEELKDVDRLADFSVGQVMHLTDRFGGFEVDHLALVTEPLIQKLHHRLS
jgi:hypothetical protein